jgi:glyoxylase-like metal-dependent hydrolase (beta-lactamase superfamily II)
MMQLAWTYDHDGLRREDTWSEKLLSAGGNMAIKQIAQGLYIIRGPVNVYVLETADGLAVLDTGFPHTASKILDGVRALGYQSNDVHHILLTHAHPDHIGSAAALKRATGATVWAHPVDAPIIEAGKGFRHVEASPGLRNKIVGWLLVRLVPPIEPTRVDQFLEDGESLPFLSDLVAKHAPGHSAGQLAFYWHRHGGVLFTADTCVDRSGPKLTSTTEDLALARTTLIKLSKLDFEIACFMHGQPIMSGGDRIFRQTSFDQ